MNQSLSGARAAIPSVDAILRAPATEALTAQYGKTAVTDATRNVLDEFRNSLQSTDVIEVSSITLIKAIAGTLKARMAPGLVPVFNLTGTVLHTNLGRAPLPQAAIDAIALTARGASNLELSLIHI